MERYVGSDLSVDGVIAIVFVLTNFVFASKLLSIWKIVRIQILMYGKYLKLIIIGKFYLIRALNTFV